MSLNPPDAAHGLSFHQVSLVVRPQDRQQWLVAPSVHVRASQHEPELGVDEWVPHWGTSPVYVMGYLAGSIASPDAAHPLPSHTHRGIFLQKLSSATCWAVQAEALE